MATVSDSHVDEDSVEYFVFPSASDVEDQLGKLEELRLQCFQFLDERARSYIWHEDSMNLAVVANPGGQDLQQHHDGLRRAAPSILVISCVHPLLIKKKKGRKS
jgi:hypothetical protein